MLQVHNTSSLRRTYTCYYSTNLKNDEIKVFSTSLGHVATTCDDPEVSLLVKWAKQHEGSNML